MLQDGYPYLPWVVSVPPPKLVARSLNWNMPTETSHHEGIQAEVTWGFSTPWSKTYHAATILRHCCAHMVPRRTIRGGNRDLGVQSWADVGTVGARVGALKFCSTAEGTGGWLWEADLFSFHIRATLLVFHHSTSELRLTLVVSSHNEVYLLVAAVLHGTPKDWPSQCTETPQKLQRPPVPPAQSPWAHLHSTDRHVWTLGWVIPWQDVQTTRLHLWGWCWWATWQGRETLRCTRLVWAPQEAPTEHGPRFDYSERCCIATVCCQDPTESGVWGGLYDLGSPEPVLLPSSSSCLAATYF